MKHFTAFLVNMLILLTTVFLHTTYTNQNTTFYVGTTFCGSTTQEAKLLIDRVKTYTNLFVLQSGPVSKNETATNIICDYAVKSGLDIIVYFGFFDGCCPWQVPWMDFAKERWGKHFLGVYYYDEPGGIQLDFNWSHFFTSIKQENTTMYHVMSNDIEGYLDGTLPRDYDDAASRFISSIENNPDIYQMKKRSVTVFTSDYALYWFDYLAGYDVVFAEFGWNNSVAQEIALVRGAARAQNKEWGAIVTWKYNHSPYLDSGNEIYNQMCMAFEAGAKYVVIFNYAEYMEGTYGTLQDEHFEALERFWNTITNTNNLVHGSAKAETTLVLPPNYGWGMRHPEDRIWYWGPDEKSDQIWEMTRNYVSEYGHTLNIVYHDERFSFPEECVHVV